ncbi:glutaminase A [Paenibacillus antri]|uniref:Glutaminase n=1 Tax=Paenibacillus antri TaxID=2582848 RepID=A0A5R9FZR1_9BACL|nr:glutaminase A [Paenibacillus antri]TLS48239.1 glutaminase A [Paenibacillus antri]
MKENANPAGIIGKDALAELIRRYRPYTKQGKVADYIPELAYTNPHALGIAVAGADGSLVHEGDATTRFTLQSISKIITLMVALNDYGPERVFSKVGMEPSVDPFNSIVKLETLDQKKPLNPMINAGAIVIASLLSAGGNPDEGLQRICDTISRIIGRNDIRVDQKVYQSERKTGDRNRALAYFMKSTGVIDADVDVEETLDLYFKACSLEVDCVDLAKIGLFFAMWGKCVQKQDDGTCLTEGIVSPRIAQIVTTIMITSGMYNHSGEFFLKVGLPAKSGVSGGIVAFAPNRYGFGIFGPAIDAAGNSVAGVRMLEDLSRTFGLHLVSPYVEF